MGAYYRMKKNSMVNFMGLYSKEQVEELEERIDELWQALSSAHSSLSVYAHMDDDYANPDWAPPFQKENDYTMERRLADIRWRCKKLRECEEKIYKVMFSDAKYVPKC